MEKIIIATSAFLGLNNRPSKYYLDTAEELYRQSPIPVKVFTQPENQSKFSIPTESALPYELAAKFWKPGWEAEYSELIKRNPTHCQSMQAKYPAVLGAWLGKLELMKRVFETTDCESVLWQDAGHIISSQLNHDAEKYSGFTIDKERMMSCVDKLMERNITLCQWSFCGRNMPEAWYREYWSFGSKPPYNIFGPFIFCQRHAFQTFYAGVQSKWEILIRDGKAGTEEDALTLLAWGFSPRTWTYEEWCENLGIKIKTPSDTPRPMKCNTRNDLPILFDAMKFNGEGVEVGVYRGDFAAELRKWMGGLLHLVDPWKHQDNYNDPSNHDDATFNLMYADVVRRFAGQNVKIHRQSSPGAAAEFKDGSLDWVYLDANHSELAVAADLMAWLPKIRSGGILSGHDYVNGLHWGCEFGVKAAVDKFASANGLTVNATAEESPTWIIPIDHEKIAKVKESNRYIPPRHVSGNREINTYRFHVIGLPHVPTSKESSCCAYSQKGVNFCKMMKSLGHEVYLYGTEGSEADCTEFIQTLSMKERTKLMGAYDPSALPNLIWDGKEKIWQIPALRAVAEISMRRGPRDFLCMISGCQKQIADMLPGMAAVEYGIGYGGALMNYRVYESYTHMAFIVGQQGTDRAMNHYHVVIPNYYDLADFHFESVKDDYCLFMGRLTALKGINDAVQMTREAGVQLLIAGQGGIVTQTPEGEIIESKEGVRIVNEKHVKYLGAVGVAERAKLMSKARAVIMPTLYHEPFGGVTAEAALCGTPVISTDWASFSETIEHGKTGYRCGTLRQFVAAIIASKSLDPHYIRQRAVSLWSLDRVKWMYQEYFDMLHDLHDQVGWGKMEGETNLHWLMSSSDNTPWAGGKDNEQLEQGKRDMGKGNELCEVDDKSAFKGSD